MHEAVGISEQAVMCEYGPEACAVCEEDSVGLNRAYKEAGSW